MKRSLSIGVTGQTGAGKSTVCDAMRKNGAAVINADKVAREVMTAGSPCVSALAKAFGEDILDSQGAIIRPVLAERAFADRHSTDMLSSITHPFIISKTQEYIHEFLNKHYDVIVFDAPQLFESGGDSLCDKVIAVTAPEDVRKCRIMRRDNIDEKSAMQRICAQHDSRYYTDRADLVIDGTLPSDKVADEVIKYTERLLSRNNEENNV